MLNKTTALAVLFKTYKTLCHHKAVERLNFDEIKT